MSYAAHTLTTDLSKSICATSFIRSYERKQMLNYVANIKLKFLDYAALPRALALAF